MTTFDYSRLPYGAGGMFSDHNRFNWRSELLLARNRDLIEGAKVLDLACNTGRLSYPCLALGAARVVGVEARGSLIEQGRIALKGCGHESRMEWVQSDVFAYLEATPEHAFDVILCFGFLYHTTRQVEFFRQIARIRPKHVIVDTSVAQHYLWYGRRAFLRKPPALHVTIEDSTKTSDTTDPDGIAFWPTVSFLEWMFERIGYKASPIRYRGEVDQWDGMQDYRKGRRVSYLAHEGA